MARRKKEFVMSKDDLAYEEPIDEVFFTDYVPPSKDAIASFSFTDDPAEEEIVFDNRKKEPTPTLSKEIPIKDNRHKPQPNGITPPIDGERYEFIRTYCFRKSTLVKLNLLKATNPDCNIYISTIIDNAICTYYDLEINKS